MSVLVHDCMHCGHRQDHHYQGVYGKCACCRGYRKESDFQPVQEPTLHETFTHPGGKPEPLYRPGTRRNAGRGPHQSDVCGCERCQELYAELSAS